MASTEPLLSSWQDEKAKVLLEDGDDNQQLERRAKARNPFNLVGSVILVLIALGIVRMIHIKIGYMLSNGKPSICIHGGSEISILNFKEVRTTFHLLAHHRRPSRSSPLLYRLCPYSLQWHTTTLSRFLLFQSSILS
jgi:hypothetical protein